MRRCVGMADEGDSKSLVLITRVGSTPTTGIKKETPPACLREFSFLSAACERVEQHGPAQQGERSALRAVAQCAGDPHLPDRMVYRSGNGRFIFCAAASAFYLLRPLRVPAVPFRLILPLQKGVFARRICGPAFPGMAVRFAERSYYAREKVPEGCSGHLFRRFLPILQCFLQKRLYK